MCTVNIRGHEANFYEAKDRCHDAEIKAEARKSEAEAEAEWFGLEALTSLMDLDTIPFDRPCSAYYPYAGWCQ